MAVIADELLLNVKANVTQAMTKLKAVEKKGGGLGSAVAGGAKVAGKAIAGIGLAAGAVGVGAGNMALDFEESMAKIEALVGVPKDEMETLRGAALDMGSEFGVSADDAAKGLFFLKSAGLDTEDAIDNMTSAAKANAIGLGTMEDLANTATTMMTNFGVEGETAYDGIAQAAKLAKADPAELGKIMNENASMANLVGVEFDELGGLSALLTRKFGDANKSGTAIQGMLSKIAKPSQQAKDMLEKVGMTTEDLKESVSKKGLAGALRDLNKDFADQGIATDEWAGKVFEDVEALKGAATIINTEGGEIEGIMGGMADKAGTLEEGWKVMAETGNVKLRKAFEGIKSALIPFGQTLQTLVVPMLETLAGWLEKGADWLSELQISSDGFNFDSLLAQFEPLRETIGSMVQWWKDHWDEISEIINVARETIMTILSDVRAWAEPFIKDFIAFIQEVFGDWIIWFQENWPAIKETIMVTLERIQQIWERVWPIIQAVLEGVWRVIKTTIKGAMKAIRGIIEFVMALIRGDWDAAWDGIKKFLSGIWDIIFGLVEGGIKNTWEILKSIMPLVKEWWDNTWDKFKEAFHGLFDGVIGIIRGPINAVLQFIEDKINSLIGLINDAIGTINKIPGVHFDKLPKVSIPKLAGGGVITKAGMALINDSTGPESIGLGRGATVRPSSPGDRSGGGGPLVHIEHMHGQDPHQVASDIGWELTKRGAV